MSILAPKSSRRRLAATFAAVLAVTAMVAGCSSGGSGGKEGGTIVFDYPYTSLPVYSVVLKAAEQEAKTNGYTVATTNDNSSQDQQISNLTTSINGNAKAIVSFPVEPSTISTLVKKAHDAGIKWVSYGTPVGGADALIDLSGSETGKVEAQQYAVWAKAHSVKNGTVLVLGNSTIDLGRVRTKGMLDGLKAYAPDATIIEADALGTDQGISVTRAQMERHPNITAVLGLNDDTAVGAGTALTEISADPQKVFVAGNDGTPVVLNDIKAGNNFIKATVALDLQQVGKAVVDVSADLLKGKKTDGYTATPIGVNHDSNQLDQLIAAFK